MTFSASLPDNHALREQLHHEAHARQAIKIKSPAQATHIALIHDGDQKIIELKHLESLCETFNRPRPSSDTLHFSDDFGNFQFQWQHHGEYSTYTFYQHHSEHPPFSQSVLNQIPAEWLKALPGKIMVAIHAAIIKSEAQPDFQDIAEHFSGGALVGAEVASGAALAFTDFKIQADGFSRFVIYDRQLNSRQAGRYLQRLCDIEVFRIMSLQAYPVAQALMPKLTRADQDLLRITTSMHQLDIDDSQLLDELTALAAEIENCFSSTHTRFVKTAAYYQLVEQRINELKEVRIPGVQTINEFLNRRLEPTINTCVVTEKRLTMLSERISKASQLLRTRVDITLERQNQSLLTSMDKRANLQLHLQSTVEGLSVAAISYYTVGLFNYIAKAIKASGIAVNPSLITGISIPIIIFFVYRGVGNIRRMVSKIHE